MQLQIAAAGRFFLFLLFCCASPGSSVDSTWGLYTQSQHLLGECVGLRALDIAMLQFLCAELQRQEEHRGVTVLRSDYRPTVLYGGRCTVYSPAVRLLPGTERFDQDEC